MTKFERVKKWAEGNGFEWRSAYGHYTKRIITHNSTPPLTLEPEEMEHFYDIAEKQAHMFAAEELRRVPQVDEFQETWLWKRIDELEGRI